MVKTVRLYIFITNITDFIGYKKDGYTFEILKYVLIRHVKR